MSSRDKILARRARFLAAAMTGLAAGGCSSSDPDGTAPQACLSADVSFDTGAEPCLSQPFDSGRVDIGSTDTSPGDTSVGDTSVGDADASDATDTFPMPCLSPPPGDAG